MLNHIWAGIIIISVICAMATGKIPELSNSVLNGANEAINLAISILGTMCLWSGIMKIAEKSNMTQKIAKILNPLIKLIFPDCPPESNCAKAICMNFTANFFGLGNAATPFGIEAMKEMKKLSKNSEASNSMIMFIVINTASLQLIPTMLCGLRQRHGSENAMKILPVLWLTSFLSLVFGIVLTKCFESKRR